MNEADIGQWRLALEDSILIDRVELVNMEKRQIEDRDITDFGFRCKLSENREQRTENGVQNE